MSRKLLLLTVALTLAAGPLAHAQSDNGYVNAQDLTPAQRAQVQADVDAQRAKALADAEAAKANAAANAPAQQVQRINEWAQIGEGVASGIGAAAHQLNVEVNAFAASPVGQWTMAIIIYKMIGREVLRYLFALIWMAVAVPIWLHFYAKLWAPDETNDEFNEKGRRVKRTVKRYRPSSDDRWLVFWASLIPVIGIVAVTLLLLP